MEIPDHEKDSAKAVTPGVSTTSTAAATTDGHEVSGGTIIAAVFGIVKAMVGPAILYLPHSFADAGYAFAIIALWICTALYLYTSNRLLGTWRFVRAQQEQKQREISNGEIELSSLVSAGEDTANTATAIGGGDRGVTKRRKGDDYDQVDTDDEVSLPTLPEEDEEELKASISYPQLARMAYGEIGENAVRAGITLMQLGVCLTYCKYTK